MSYGPTSRFALAALVTGLFLAALSACTTGPAASKPDKTAIVMAYIDAYNDHDIEALRPMLHPDVDWLEPSDSGPKLVTSSREELLAYLETAFMSETVITTTMSDLEVTSEGVRGIETASWWASEDEQKSWSAPVAYAISDDGLIQRVEYLPVVVAGS